MADAIVLPTVVLLAVATFAHCFGQAPFLGLTCHMGLFSVIIETALALANSRNACFSGLDTNAVELATVTTLAITSP